MPAGCQDIVQDAVSHSESIQISMIARSLAICYFCEVVCRLAPSFVVSKCVR